MTITLNGEKKELDVARTVVTLLRELELPEQGVLVEQNGKALHREEWGNLAEGDRIEILRIVAGG